MQMNNKDSFDRIATLISSSEIHSEDGFIVIKLPNPYNKDEKTSLQASFSKIGYLKSEGIFEGDSALWLDKRANFWFEGHCPFYSNYETFWQRVHSSEKLPDYFYIVSNKLSHLDIKSNKTLNIFNLYFT